MQPATGSARARGPRGLGVCHRGYAFASVVDLSHLARTRGSAIAVARSGRSGECVCGGGTTELKPTPGRSGMIQNGLLGFAILGAASLLCASCGSQSNSGAATQGTAAAAVPTVEVAKVCSKKLSILVRLPGELQAFETVAVFPKVTAYVDSIVDDPGSRVKAGKLMARLVAPQLAAQRAEAAAKLPAPDSHPAQSQPKLTSDERPYE